MDRSLSGPAWFLLAATAAFAGFLWWQQDDFYIHLQYARHLAESGEWSFNAGHPTYGSTSPLWVMLLAGLGKLGLPLVLAAKLSSVALAVLSVWLLLRNRERLFQDERVAWCCTASLVANHWYRLAAGGAMEATLCAVLVLWLGIRLTSVEHDLPESIVEGMLVGLIVLARPEFILAPLILLLLRRDTLTKRAAFIAGLAVVLVPWATYALTTFGTVIPNTAVVKALAVDPLSSITPGRIAASAVRIVAFYLPTNSAELLGAAMLAVLQLRGASDVRADPLRSTDRSAAVHVGLAIWALVLLVPATYFLNQIRGGVELTYRYAAPTLPLLVLVGWIGIDRWLARPSSTAAIRSYMLSALVLLALAGNAGMTVLHLPSLLRSDAYIDNVLTDYGRWLGQHATATDVVAAYDVGALAYFSRRPVLDLVGLNSPEVIPLRKADRGNALSAAAIRKFRPAYLVTLQEAPLSAYNTVLPPYTVERSALVSAYRFTWSAVWQPQRRYPVALLRLHWPAEGSSTRSVR